MKNIHQSLRKIISILFTLLLVFTTFPSCYTGAVSESFTYDANGNMISGSGLIYIYNDVNQLIKIINESSGNTVAEYFYDSNGQRVKKIENGIITYYISDIVEMRMTGSTVYTTSYYFANNERVARKDPDGSVYYYYGDHLGSTSIVTDETGALSEKRNYYPYGSVNNLTCFNWTSRYVKVPTDAEVKVPLEVNIPNGESGYKVFYAKLELRKWAPTVMGTGILYMI